MPPLPRLGPASAQQSSGAAECKLQVWVSPLCSLCNYFFTQLTLINLPQASVRLAEGSLDCAEQVVPTTSLAGLSLPLEAAPGFPLAPSPRKTAASRHQPGPPLPCLQ